MVIPLRVTSLAILLLALAWPAHAAVDVRATAGMNIRSGPGVGYGRVGSMAENAPGDLLECTPEGRWCRVRTSNATGWIAGAFLVLQSGDLQGRRVRDVAGRISFDEQEEETPSPQTASTEPSGEPQPEPEPAETAVTAPQSREVCFYSEFESEGEADCYSGAKEAITLGRSWNDRIASLSVPEGFAVTVCDNYGLTGRCQTFSSSVDRMPASLNGRISSWRIEEDS